MDMIKSGNFLSELRKKNNLTQFQLGDKLGVTNKTISRWETGTYMPPVEMLELLSNLYDVSINEILSGAKLNSDDYKEKAEENIKSALSASTFTLKEKIKFFKKKWRKENLFKIVMCCVSWQVILVLLKLQYVENFILGTVGGLLAVLFYVMLYNQMMSYVEANAFQGKGR